jgi:hypothetical protein
MDGLGGGGWGPTDVRYVFPANALTRVAVGVIAADEIRLVGSPPILVLWDLRASENRVVERGQVLDQRLALVNVPARVDRGGAVHAAAGAHLKSRHRINAEVA